MDAHLMAMLDPATREPRAVVERRAAMGARGEIARRYRLMLRTEPDPEAAALAVGMSQEARSAIQSAENRAHSGSAKRGGAFSRERPVDWNFARIAEACEESFVEAYGGHPDEHRRQVEELTVEFETPLGMLGFLARRMNAEGSVPWGSACGHDWPLDLSPQFERWGEVGTPAEGEALSALARVLDHVLLALQDGRRASREGVHGDDIRALVETHGRTLHLHRTGGWLRENALMGHDLDVGSVRDLVTAMALDTLHWPDRVRDATPREHQGLVLTR